METPDFKKYYLAVTQIRNEQMGKTEIDSKMKVLIVLGHPDNRSFNHAIAKACKTQIESNGHSVFFHDLYAENFSPLHHIDNTNSDSTVDAEIHTHCSQLADSDGIIVIHPNWWGQPPAIIKGWIDRVLMQGIAYDFVENDEGAHVPVGLLKAKIGLVLNTSNTPNDIGDDPLDSIWKNRVFNFCGVDQVERRNFCVVKDSDENQRSLWLSEVQSMINSYFPKIK